MRGKEENEIWYEGKKKKSKLISLEENNLKSSYLDEF